MEARGLEIDHIRQTQTDRKIYEQAVRPIDRLTNKETNKTHK